MNLIDQLNQKNMKGKITDFKVGDTVQVHQKIVEGKKERDQVFEGVVIKTRCGKNINGTFTVRKIAEGVGVEKTYLVHSPRIIKIVVVRRGKVRRANLSYLRNLRGKKARLKEKQFDSLVVNVDEEKEATEQATIDAAEAEKRQKIEEAEALKKKKTEPKAEKNENKGKSHPTDDQQDDEKLDIDITELDPEELEDEEKTKDTSTEEVAKEEARESNKIHRKEEEGGAEDETSVAEQEVEEGLERAEEEDTKRQG